VNMNDLSTSLLITLVGMGIVFAIIVLLWWLIALVANLGGRMSRSLAAREDSELENQRLAASVAVATALALVAESESMQSVAVNPFPLPATAVVSPWQAVMRAKILNRRGSVR
jgi:Na+-transporting methylmalonyl-CoA/oxaloacetate decarboxylase gamma subunit